jgi:Flp pilus assembly pilin Flp
MVQLPPIRMLTVFAALAIAVGAQTLGGGITDLFNKVSTSLASVTMPTL